MYKTILFILLGLLLTSSVFANDCYPPAISNLPASISESHCSTIAFDFDAQLDPLDNQSNIITFTSSIGTIDSDGLWTYDPLDTDVHNPPELIITVSNGTCETQYPIPFEVTNQAPVITNCLDQINLCLLNRYVIQYMTADDECDDIRWFIKSYDGGAIAIIDSITGGLIIEESNPGSYILELFATDHIDTSYCNINIGAMSCSPNGEIGLTVSNDNFLGQTAEVTIYGWYYALGEVNLSLAYYANALSVVNVIPIELEEEGKNWEYFQYKVYQTNYTSENNPINLLKIKGVANFNNIYVSQNIAIIKFLITNDPIFECAYIPVNFFWESCNDNIITYLDNHKVVSDYVYTNNHSNEISDSTTGYPTLTGVQGIAGCDNGDEIIYSHTLDFGGAGIDIACVDPVPRRGDINLNGVPYEIADAVLLTNFFIKGIIVFDINPNAQLEQSDINADGYKATIADLVYLYRVIFGEVYSYPKLSSFQTKISHNNGIVNVRDEISAAFIISKGNAQPELIAQNMTLEYRYDNANDQTRILIYSTNTENSFVGDFLRLENEISSIELASKDGAVVTYDLLPSQVLLHQNHPNPFNPTTTISFDLPQAAFASITIYNITGQKVNEFSREFSAGLNQIEWDGTDYASGIYYYKIETEGFAQTKKMMLIK